MWYDKHNWIEYSQARDAIFCYVCRHFSLEADKCFTTVCFRNWKKASESKAGLQKHSLTKTHIDGVVAMKEYENFKVQNSSICQMMSDTYKAEIEENRHLIKTIGEVLLLSAMQDISQRGHRENDENVNDGNFKQIINLIARHDAVVKKKMDQSAQNAKYTSNTIQNEILDTLVYMVRDSIVEDVKHAQYFSLIADETKDISKTEII